MSVSRDPAEPDANQFPEFIRKLIEWSPFVVSVLIVLGIFTVLELTTQRLVKPPRQEREKRTWATVGEWCLGYTFQPVKVQSNMSDPEALPIVFQSDPRVTTAAAKNSEYNFKIIKIFALTYSMEKVITHVSSMVILHGSKASAVSLLLPISKRKKKMGAGQVYTLEGNLNRDSLFAETSNYVTSADRKKWTKFDVELKTNKSVFDLSIHLILGYDTYKSLFEALVCSMQKCVSLGKTTLTDYDPLGNKTFWVINYVGNGHDFNESDPGANNIKWSVVLVRVGTECSILDKQGQYMCPGRSMNDLRVCWSLGSASEIQKFDLKR